MDAGAVVAMIAAPIALVVVSAGLGFVYREIPRGGASRRNSLVSLSVAVAGSLVWLVLGGFAGTEVVDGLFPSIAVLAGLAALLATFAVRERVENALPAIVFAVAWCAAVFVPVAVTVFSTSGFFQSIGIHPLDHGGALAVFIAPAAASLAIILTERAGDPRATTEGHPSAPVWVNLAMGAGWVIALAGLEVALDDSTLRIVVNVVLAAAFGVVGWLVVQRIQHRVAGLPGVAAGFVAGLAGVTPGAAFIDPIWACVTGLAAATLSASFVYSRMRKSQRGSWFIVGGHLIAPATGLLLLALFASGLGFVFTGQIGLAQAEVTAIVAVAVYSAVVSCGLWLLVRFALIRRPVEGA